MRCSVSSRWLSGLLAMIGLGLSGLVVLLLVAGAPLTRGGRLLSAVELADTFGDCKLCKRSYACRIPFKVLINGVPKCAYCDSQGSRVMCCENSEPDDTCQYDGTKNPCGAVDRPVADLGGTADCDTCTGTGPWDHATHCGSEVNADTGNDCD